MLYQSEEEAPSPENFLPNFMGTWDFWFFLQETASMPIKFLVFFGGGGEECQFFLYRLLNQG